MQYGIPAELSREIIQLMEKQMYSLEKETFLGVTDVEKREYEQRQERIDRLCEELQYLHPSA